MRLPVLLGTGDPDSRTGQAGVGDCWSCLELCEQERCHDYSAWLSSDIHIQVLPEKTSTAQEAKPESRREKSSSGKKKNPCKSRTRRKLTSQVAAKPYRAFLSISRSSCRLLHPGGRPRPQGLVSRAEGWELGTQLIGGEVKQVLGLDSDRSSLTGVGLILREGFVLLRVVRFFFFSSNFYLQASFHPLGPL